MGASGPAAKGRIAFVVALVLVAGGCAVMLASGHHSSRSSEYTPPPGVSDVDAAFLKKLHGEGITNDDGDTALIKLAHTTCMQLAGGMSVDGIAEHWGLTSKRMSTDSARFFVRTAAAAYCPQYL